jgi:UDP-2,3-diacylglucosamine pyrophosphatase LpxH
MAHLNWSISFFSISNFILTRFGREKISFSKRIKHSVKSAVSYINKFEETAADIAISKGYSYVICGHIHQPEIRKISNSQGEVIYLNSGDWVENLSSLEYHKGKWRIYHFRDDPKAQALAKDLRSFEPPSHKESFDNLLHELKMS